MTTKPDPTGIEAAAATLIEAVTGRPGWTIDHTVTPPLIQYWGERGKAWSDEGPGGISVQVCAAGGSELSTLRTISARSAVEWSEAQAGPPAGYPDATFKEKTQRGV